MDPQNVMAIETVPNVKFTCGYRKLSELGVYGGEQFLAVKFLDDNEEFHLTIINLFC